MALIVFIKNFQRGKVKTRLAGTLGNDEALKIYRQLCIFTVREVQKTGLPAYFYFSEWIDDAFLGDQGIDLHSGKYHAKVQIPSDLGTRMGYAFREVLAHHTGALVMGTDCPYFDANQMSKAQDMLVRPDTDIVLGPAHDGGYYGLGMKQLYGVFSGIDWSTEHVLSQTVSKIKSANLNHVLLPKLNDIDFEEDWDAFKNSSSMIYFQEVIRASSSARDTLE